MNQNHIKKIVDLLKNFKILGLPTESVYGISAIIHQKTIKKIIEIKKRDENKGFIIISGCIRHLLKVINKNYIDENLLIKIKEKRKEVITWIAPVNPKFRWLTGSFNSIAIRYTKHPLLSKITQELNKAIISTSANISGMPPSKSAGEVYKYFGDKIDYIYEEKNFIASKPSKLINILNEKIIRN